MIFTGVALDLGTKTGWAATRQDNPPACGVFEINSPFDDDADWFRVYGDWLDRLLDRNNPHFVVYEAAIRRHGKKGRILTAHPVAMKLYGLVAITKYICAKRKIPKIFEADNSTVCKFFTGKGRWANSDEKKQKTIDACRRRAWNPTDHNAADALAMWAYADSLFNPMTGSTIEHYAGAGMPLFPVGIQSS